MQAGNAFHSLGAMDLYCLSPYVTVLAVGTTRVHLSMDLNDLLGWYTLSILDIYLGASPCRAL